MSEFIKLGIDEKVAEVLAKQGITEPMAIQTQAIPQILAGSNIIGQAPTGTGKTLAYLLPAKIGRAHV